MAFASYAMPIVAITAIVSNYLPAYYSEVADISLTQIGVVFFLLRSFDLVTDLGIGMLIDRSNSRFGKYRPWLLISVPIAAFGTYLMYLPDDQAISATYIFMGGLIMYIGYTMALISHQAWGSNYFNVSHTAITRFFGYREIWVILGLALAYIIPAVIEQGGGTTLKEQVNAVGIVLVVGIPLFAVLALVSTPDVAAADDSQKASLASIKLVLKERPMQYILLTNVLVFAGLIAAASMSPFLIRNVLEMGDVFARSQAVFFSAALVCIVPWIYLAKKYGEKRTLIYCAIYMPLAHLFILVVSHYQSPILLAVFMGFSGAAFSAFPFLLRALAGLEAVRIENDSGQNVRGVIFGLVTMSEKMGGALAVLIALPLIEALGFQSGQENSSDVLSNVFYVYLCLPMLAFLAIIVPAKKLLATSDVDIRPQEPSETNVHAAR